MTYIVDTGHVKANPCFEDFFYARRLSESSGIYLDVIVDSVSNPETFSEPTYKEQLQAFVAMSQFSLARFVDDGEDYSNW